MSSIYVESVRVPVTRVTLGPCVVTQVKKVEKDGYWAVQLGFGIKKIKNLTKPLQGHLKSVIKDKTSPRYLREIRSEKEPEFKVGDQIKVSEIFKKGDVVAVTGTSKGKGFAGVVKRWGFAGGPKTHGQSDRQRAPGSIGQGTTPGRVHKGKHMAGRMGNDRVTVKNLFIVDINPETHEIAISGALPGAQGKLLLIKKLHAGKLSELVEETPQVIQEEVIQEKTEGGEDGQASPEEKQN